MSAVRGPLYAPGAGRLRCPEAIELAVTQNSGF